MVSKKILLVDDTGTMLLMEQMILGGGWQLVTAGGGEAALQAAFTHAPDLILLDLTLPRMDGFEVCRRLRAHERTRATPIVLVIPRGEEGSVEKGFQHGCTDFLVKPVHGVGGAELLARIKGLLGE